ncbi:MAG: right-handed parallel beta-helix repeat-containing protein [Candidatus Methanoplasma sp.]|nr:right-handed parallel beta-helix repeat-containing protein [Candidatus Methanoplasma sp.]
MAVSWNSDQDPGTDPQNPPVPPIGTYTDIGPRPNNYDDPADGIYVSPTGNDETADGSKNKPYRSINTALTTAEPGDTIILRGGTYKEGRDVRIQTSDITIKSAKGEWAVIDLTNLAPGDESSVIMFQEDRYEDGVDRMVSGCKLQAIEAKGGFYVVCFDTMWDWGQANRGGASNIIIEDCVLHDSKNDVIKIKPNCDNITIRYNNIFNSGREHVGHSEFLSGECNSEGIDNVNGDNMIVRNNHIYNICSNGVYAKGGAINALIENNCVENTYGAGIMVGFDTSPEFFDTGVNPQYYENIGGVVRNNLIIHTGWEGIGLYASKDAQVYNNTLVDVMNYADHTRIPHSAIYFGLTYQDWAAGAGRPANVNPDIHHNIVSQPATFTQHPMIEIRYSGDLGGMSALSGNPTMSNNCYYIAGKSAAFVDNRPVTHVVNVDLAGWKSHITGDSGSIEVNPGLDSNYKPTNPQCAGMGCNFP